MSEEVEALTGQVRIVHSEFQYTLKKKKKTKINGNEPKMPGALLITSTAVNPSETPTIVAMVIANLTVLLPQSSVVSVCVCGKQ